MKGEDVASRPSVKLRDEHFQCLDGSHGFRRRAGGGKALHQEVTAAPTSLAKSNRKNVVTGICRVTMTAIVIALIV